MKMKKMNTEGRTEVRSKAVIATAAIALALIMIASSALILSGNDNDDGTGYVLGADDTVDISSCTDADDVRAAIEGKIAGMGAGDTLTVTGSLTGITECLTLDIGVIDIRWCAEYSAEVTDGNVLDITSDGGMFTVSVNGTDEGIMTLTGDVEVNSSADAALIAAGGGKLTIDGNVTVTAADGDLWLYSFNNGILTIDGNVTVTAADGQTAVCAYLSSELTVYGDVTVTVTNGPGEVYSYTDSKVTIDGNVTITTLIDGNVTVYVVDVSEMTISGNVSAISAGEYADISAYGQDSVLSIGGNVTAESTSEASVYAQQLSEVSIGGDVTVIGVNVALTRAWEGSTFIVDGNVTAADGTYTSDGGLVVIHGTLYVEDEDECAWYFDGWNNIPVAKSVLVAGIGSGALYPTYMYFTDATAGDIYVKDILMPHTVSYDINGGSGTVPTETDKVLGDTFTAADDAGMTAPSGAQFKEWNTEADGSGTSYVPGDTVTMPDDDLVLYAIWENIYTVTYDISGGTGAVPTESDKVFGDTFTAADADGITAPEGKQFKEWNTASDGSGISYAPGDTVTMPDDDLVLYAIWDDIPEDSGLNVGVILVIAIVLLIAVLAIGYAVSRR